jgi:ribosomal protein S12 methylthiotransferase accessory factor
VAPGVTLQRLQPLLGQVGITRVANVTGMDTVGIPTVIVTRPNARSLSVSQGKGVDLDSAKVSGLMESIEQWHAERIDRPLRLGSQADLQHRLPLADVDRLPRFILPFNPHVRALWIEGIDLVSGGSRWVPYDMVHLDLTLPLPPGGHFVIGSNGLASGNHPLEAVVHGLAELIERDATSLFYQLGWQAQWRRRLDLDSVEAASCRSLIQAFDQAGVEVAVWDTTSDVGVPSYLCSILDRDPNPFRPVGLARGAGCHPDASVALSRALTEAAQSRLTRIVGSRDDIQREDFAALQSDSGIEQARLQLAAPGRPPARLAASRGFEGRTVEDDLGWMLGRLEQVGIDQVVAVDLSRSDMPVFVVRVVAPGLEASSDAPGYRPGDRARGRMGADA